jgi:pyruvate/2-oxoacid:ferredoxin oxidoreductase alpha subunit
MFNEVLYEVQIIERNIESIYRSDGREITTKEFEGVRDYIYEDLLK